ncbi:MAG: DUF4255 domain-containing protein [Verrucomicrobiota bacterium]|nr:DUF4255 domain-containing protein [Verrucomicrobiota bacterium]
MSTAYAIAAVTAVLRSLIDSALKVQDIDAALGTTVTVSALPPDRVNPDAGADPDQLNLFLHGVEQNPGWRNLGLPTRNPAGDRVSSPPLALDLHYTLTAFGSKELFAEALLGHGMQAFHEIPFLTRQRIIDTLKVNGSSSNFDKALNVSLLSDQLEQIKITPAPFSADDISKLWTALQGRYRPTAAYIVTVVLIESGRSSKSALPILTRNIQVLPFAHLAIDSIVNADDETAPILPGSSVRIAGHGFNAAKLLLIDGLDLTSAITHTADTEIKLTLPNSLPAGLHAGLVTAQVFQPVPGISNPQAGFSSNITTFALRPSVTATRLSHHNSTLNGITVRSGDIQLTFTTPVGKNQRVTLLLNEKNPPSTRAAYAYRFDAPPGNGVVDPATETSAIVLPYKNVAPGAYLVRAQVDGAESVLQLTAGKYSSPNITI